MGCYAMAACKRKGMEVVLATNDKDLYQLIGPCVKVYTTAKADLASAKDAFALLGEEQATAKWDVPPKLIGDVLAIAGDSVDNIPGAGIGRKTAAGLIREFGGQREFVRYHHDRVAVLLRQLPQALQQFHLRADVQMQRGLIEQYQPRLLRQSPRKNDALFFAA